MPWPENSKVHRTPSHTSPSLGDNTHQYYSSNNSVPDTTLINGLGRDKLGDLDASLAVINVQAGKRYVTTTTTQPYSPPQIL